MAFSSLFTSISLGQGHVYLSLVLPPFISICFRAYYSILTALLCISFLAKNHLLHFLGFHLFVKSLVQVSIGQV